MNTSGLSLCCRYSYPPNSLSLCGPDKKNDLLWYTSQQIADSGTSEILADFATLYPYLKLIASENKMADPFDKSVVEAYWLGNNLLTLVNYKNYLLFLAENLMFKKKLNRKEIEKIFQKITYVALPHHSYHVLNIYKRTGHLEIPHTLKTMDACLINWGKVKQIKKGAIIIETQPLKLDKEKLVFGQTQIRQLLIQGEKDKEAFKLEVGDWISYHWGYFCQKLSQPQLQNLIYFTNISLRLANLST